MLPQISTIKAAGETSKVGLPLPKMVEFSIPIKSGSNFAINWLELGLKYEAFTTGKLPPLLCPKIKTLSFLSISTKRSEEHTSELQSRPHLVCRLLLEKKKKKKE